MTDELPSQREIDAVAAVFDKLKDDPVGSASAIIVTKMLKRALAEAQEADEAARPCPHCNGLRWVEDENWSPPEVGWSPYERTPRDGLIPCGGCNFAGWSTPLSAPR